MKLASDLSPDELVAIVESIQGCLYLDLDGNEAEFWNPDKPWSGDEFEFIAQVLTKHGLVPEKTELAKSTEEVEPCDCQRPGDFCSGVPGILAHVENCRVVLGGKVERCDACQRYPSDQEAHDKLVELGMA